MPPCSVPVMQVGVRLSLQVWVHLVLPPRLLFLQPLLQLRVHLVQLRATALEAGKGLVEGGRTPAVDIWQLGGGGREGRHESYEGRHESYEGRHESYEGRHEAYKRIEGEA